MIGSVPRGEAEKTIKDLLTAADTKAGRSIERGNLESDAALLMTLRVKCIAMETALLALARELDKTRKGNRAIEGR
jgi:hypothetical protein